LGRLHIRRGAGLDLDEAQGVAVPAHQVNLPATPPRAEVARDDCVSLTPQVKVGSLLAAPPRNKVRRRPAGPGQKPGNGVEDAERELEQAWGHRAESPILRCTWDESPIIPAVATTADRCVGYETSPNHFTGKERDTEIGLTSGRGITDQQSIGSCHATNRWWTSSAAGAPLCLGPGRTWKRRRCWRKAAALVASSPKSVHARLLLASWPTIFLDPKPLPVVRLLVRFVFA